MPEDERQEADDKFKTIQQAYEILSDDNNRELYDKHGMAAFEKGGAGGGAGPDLDDILAQMFGGMGGGMGGGMPTGGSSQIYVSNVCCDGPFLSFLCILTDIQSSFLTLLAGRT